MNATLWLLAAIAVILLVALCGSKIARGMDETADALECSPSLSPVASGCTFNCNQGRQCNCGRFPSRQMTPAERAAPTAAHQRMLKEVEADATHAAIVDARRGVHRPNPHTIYTRAHLAWTFAYELAYMEVQDAMLNSQGTSHA